MSEMRATCNDCGYSGTLLALKVHSCYVQEMGGRCEDYPACGHTDGDGCQTLPEHTSEYYLANPAATHLGCDHNTGHCNYEDDYVDPETCEHPDTSHSYDDQWLCFACDTVFTGEFIADEEAIA